jgi:ubiquitin C-terminal hydrolase
MYAILQKQPTIQRPDSYQASLLRLLHGTVNHDLRKVLYSMLLQTESLGLVTYVRDLVKMINPKQSSSPKTTKYVGLYNLGCICYMNSMLQQFYMTDELRNAILSVQLPADLPLVEVKGKKHVENVLYQLQRMFSYLNLSDRSDYNIEGFCYSFKSNINVGIQ